MACEQGRAARAVSGPCTRVVAALHSRTSTHPPLLLLPVCACRQGKTNLRASAMMTRKHNAAVKAQQKAERDKLRGQMRCVLLLHAGALWVAKLLRQEGRAGQLAAARLAVRAHATCACFCAGLQRGAACRTGSQGAEEGGSGQRVRRARRREHPRLVHVSLGWEMATSRETISWETTSVQLLVAAGGQISCMAL